MVCFIYKWLISWSMDSGKPVSRFIQTHVDGCAACRGYSNAMTDMATRLVRDGKRIEHTDSSRSRHLTEKIIASLSSQPHVQSPPMRLFPKKRFFLRPAFAFGMALLLLLGTVIWISTPGKAPEPVFSIEQSPLFSILKQESISTLSSDLESPIHKELEGLKHAAASAKDFLVGYLTPEKVSL